MASWAPQMTGKGLEETFCLLDIGCLQSDSKHRPKDSVVCAKPHFRSSSGKTEKYERNGRTTIIYSSLKMRSTGRTICLLRNTSVRTWRLRRQPGGREKGVWGRGAQLFPHSFTLSATAPRKINCLPSTPVQGDSKPGLQPVQAMCWVWVEEGKRSFVVG